MSSANVSLRQGRASGTARAPKFSVIRNFPTSRKKTPEAGAAAAAAAAATDDGGDGERAGGQRQSSADAPMMINTVQVLHDRRSTENEEEVVEERIRRHRYAQFIAHFNEQRRIFLSTGVFVEAMLKEVQHSSEAGVAVEAAVATWGLRLLAKQSEHSALDSILTSLLPALYCEYSPEKLGLVSPAVQLQVRDRDVLLENPYFTHSMYVDEVQLDKKSAVRFQLALEAAVRANDERRNMAVRLIERLRRQRLRLAFRGWHNATRHERLVRMMGNNTAKQRAKETTRLYLQASFYQWKLLVERSRCAYLTERLHDAASQLENAKNQFQLQCYRADRLAHTAKEATDEMDRVLLINDDLLQKIEVLKAEQERREAEYSEKLTRNVTHILTILGSYDALTQLMLRSKKAAELCLVEKSFSTEMSLLAEDVEHPRDDIADVSWESPSDTALQLLREWCDGLLKQGRGHEEAFHPIRSFGKDFANGERYLYLFQSVFPEVVSSVLSIHDIDVETRLRRIRGYATQCGLRYTLVPSDFLNEREDLLVCSLGELYQRYGLRVWDQSVQKSVAELNEFREGEVKATLEACTVPVEVKEVTADVAGAVLDEAAVRASIDDYVGRLKLASEHLSASFAAESELLQTGRTILEKESRLGGERLQGIPIPIVEEAHRRAFWALPVGVLDDLRELPELRVEGSMWDVVTAQTLPALLQEHVDATSRVFFHYAGENAKILTEASFWSFVENFGLLVEPAGIPMEWIASQYDHVVTPQLDTALKAVARNQNEMSVQKLRQVAYQEMDIRAATPLQFVELLVRLAVVAEKSNYGLVEGTRRLLQGLQMPTKEKLSPVVQVLHTSEVQHVFDFFREDLFRVFLFYVKQQESSRNAQDSSMATQHGGRFASHMSITILLNMLEDCRFLSDKNARISVPPPVANELTRPRSFISSLAVRRLVGTLERLGKGIQNGGLSFNRFVEVLVVLAQYWCPDLLVPAARRTAAFLAYMVQQLSARHMNTTLLLGVVPTISLEGPSAVDFSYEARVAGGTAL